MMPTLHEMGDIVAVDALTFVYGLRPLQRGDIIIANAPGRGPHAGGDAASGEDYQVCKRVIALEGDLVQPVGNVVPLRVPPGHVWVEGDNPHNSVDSRFYGPLPTALIRGRVLCRVWPFHRARSLVPEQALDAAGSGASAEVAASGTLHGSPADGVEGWLQGATMPFKPPSNEVMLHRMLEDEAIMEDARATLQAARKRLAEREARMMRAAESRANSHDSAAFTPSSTLHIAPAGVDPAPSLVKAPPAAGDDDGIAISLADVEALNDDLSLLSEPETGMIAERHDSGAAAGYIEALKSSNAATAASSAELRALQAARWLIQQGTQSASAAAASSLLDGSKSDELR